MHYKTINKILKWGGRGIVLICVILLAILASMWIYIPSTFPHKYTCSTDEECTQECIMNCGSKEECRNCWDIFINEDNYDLYERKYDELLWKHEAY